MARSFFTTATWLALVFFGLGLSASAALAQAQSDTAGVAVEQPVAAEAGDGVAPESASSTARLREAIDASRARIRGFETEEKSFFDMLEELDRSAETLKKEVRVAQKRVTEARATVANVSKKRKELEAKQAQTKRVMAKRIVALYKAGDVGPVRILFSSHSLQDLLSVGHVVAALLKMDRELLVRFQDESRRLDHIHEELAAAAEAERAAARVFDTQMAQFEREKSARRAAIAMLRSNRVRERGMLRELEASERALEETLQEMGTAGEGSKKSRLWPFRKTESSLAPDFKSRKGKLMPPVRASVVSSFGKVVDTEFKTATVRHGIEYGAALGDEVHAVASGTVRYAGWFRGYGKMVILDHGEKFFTLYGHLEDVHVKVGDVAMEGVVLATVGETGSLEGPRLYFEVREGGTPRDPLDWLAKAK